MLENKIQDLEKKIEVYDQNSRRNCLRFFGVSEATEENTEAVVSEICTTLLAANVKIEKCYRIRHRSGDKYRPILVKFSSYKDRALVYKYKRALKDSKITIREDLTKNHLNLLRSAITKFGRNRVWTRDGVVFANIDNKVSKIIIDNLE